MKASELVTQLQTLIATHGDQPVFVPNIDVDVDDADGDEVEVAGVCTALTDNKATSFLVADRETCEAYM